MEDLFSQEGTVKKRTVSELKKSIDKVGKFGWNPASEFGKKGKFKFIAKENICVDQQYQRVQSIEKARRIAASFSWPAFGCLLVSLRSNGTYFAIDGGHRVTGAFLRDEVNFVPCYVLEGLSRDEEAAIFVLVNKHRKPMSGVELYKAQLVAKDPDVAACEKVLSEFGYHIQNGGHADAGIQSPQTVLMLHKAGTLRDVLSLISLAWPTCQERRMGTVLNAAGRIIGSLKKYNISVEEVSRVLKKEKLASIVADGRGISRIQNYGLAFGIYIAMAKLWTSGRKNNRISFTEVF
jgi:hypothetical protein